MRQRIINMSKSTLILIILVAAITGRNLWLHRNDPPLMVHYSEYDINFNHRNGGDVNTGTEHSRIQSYMEGSYQVCFVSQNILSQNTYGFLEHGIYWFPVENVAVSADENILEASLNMKLEEWGSKGIWFSRDEPIMSSEKDGHEMIYTFIVSSRPVGYDLPGIVSAWRVGERIFIFYTFYTDNVENPLVDTRVLTAIWKHQLCCLKCA